MTSFLKNNYQVLPKAISTDLANFCFEYLKIKKESYKLLNESNIIYDFESPDKSPYGTESQDPQAPSTWSIYGDPCMETLLKKLKQLMEQTTQLDLVEQYAYARLYKKGDELKVHTDRVECEISTTLNLGGDLWPIYLAPNQKIDLTPGDMLVYKGAALPHWRETFDGEVCGQVFLHYTNKQNKMLNKDGRKILGLVKIDQNLVTDFES